MGEISEPLRTVVLGASPNPARYSFMAVRQLLRHGFTPIPLGLRAGEIDGVEILTGTPALKNIDTVTLYVGPDRQPDLYEYILGLNPRRLIFNPGTENPELLQLAREKGIDTSQACSLVLLSTGQY